jgi:hypothetical protein
MENIKNAYRILLGKNEGKRRLGRRRYMWRYDIEMDRREQNIEF